MKKTTVIVFKIPIDYDENEKLEKASVSRILEFLTFLRLNTTVAWGNGREIDVSKNKRILETILSSLEFDTLKNSIPPFDYFLYFYFDSFFSSHESSNPQFYLSHSLLLQEPTSEEKLFIIEDFSSLLSILSTLSPDMINKNENKQIGTFDISKFEDAKL